MWEGVLIHVIVSTGRKRKFKRASIKERRNNKNKEMLKKKNTMKNNFKKQLYKVLILRNATHTKQSMKPLKLTSKRRKVGC